jgi:hypothetical protein
MFTRSTKCRAALATAAAVAVALPGQAAAERPASAGFAKKADATAAGVKPTPFSFVGATAQFPCQFNTDNVFCGTVNVFMSRDMKRVKRMILGFEATCQAPDQYFATNVMLQGIPAKPSRRGSSFGGTTKFDAALADDLTAKARLTVSGRAKAGGAGRGTFDITIDIVDASGKTIDTCHTGRQSYTLKATKKR